MTCANCEAPVKDESRFCENCGTPVGARSEKEAKIAAYEKAIGYKYRILKKIGSGGFAEVFLGEHVLLGRKVAIKILHGSWSDQEDMVERFRRESKAAAKLSHPNIIDIYDVGDSDGIYYFVMKYVEGETLAHRLFHDKKIAPGEAIQITRQLADALGYAHEHDVIHRDIKPANVMIDPYGKPVLMDFGIARVQLEGNLTRTGTLMGTPHYLPPEQPLGKRVDGRSDIYSLGIVFYEMLTGRPPFTDENSVSLIFKHINEEPPRLEELNPDLHPDLCSVVYRMIEKLPENRYQSAYEVAEALEPLASIYPVSSPRRSSGGQARNTEQLLALARENLEQQKFDRAIEIYGTVLKRDPGNLVAKHAVEEIVTVINRRMMDHAEKNEFSEAKALLVQIQKLPISREQVTLLRGELEAAEHRFFKDTELRTSLDEARSALDNDNASAAIERLTKALTIDPSHPEAQELLRKARAAHEGKRQKAEYAKAYSEAEYHFNSRSYDQALAAIKKAVEIDSSPEAIRLQEKIEAASKEKAYRQAEQERLFAQVDKLCEELDFEGAREVLEQGSEMFPVPVQFKRAVVDRAESFHRQFAAGAELFADQKWEEARRAFEEFLRVPQPYDFQVFYRLRKDAESRVRACGEQLQAEASSRRWEKELKKADVLLRMGLLHEAREEVQRILASDPDAASAAERLREIDAAIEARKKSAEAPEPVPMPEMPEPDVPDMSHTMQLPSSGLSALPPVEPPVEPPAPPPMVRTVPSVSYRPVSRPAVAPRPTPASRQGAAPRAYWILGAVALAVVITAMAWFLHTPARPVVTDQPQQKTNPQPLPPPAPAPLAVSLDAMPWANLEIKPSAGGDVMKAQTPALVQLPPGQYTVVFSNPDLPRFTKTINVQPGNTSFTFSFDQLNPNQIADSLLHK